jgi:hypothetical protein
MKYFNGCERRKNLAINLIEKKKKELINKLFVVQIFGVFYFLENN